MIKFPLIFVYIVNGQPTLKHYGFAEYQACIDSAYALAVSSAEAGHAMISAECYAVAPSWGMR